MVPLIIVDFNSSESLEVMLASLEDHSGGKVFAPIVISNGNSEAALNKLNKVLERWPGQIQRVCYDENLGYMGGFCRFLQENPEILDRHGWVVMANSDMLFTARMLDEAQLDGVPKHYSVVAPGITDMTTAQPLNPHLRSRFSEKAIRLLCFVYNNFAFARGFELLNKLRNQKPRVATTDREDIYAPHGSFVMMRSDLCRQMDTRGHFFMYAEEIFIAERCRERGEKVLFFPDFQIIHNSHQTTGNHLSLRKFNWIKEGLAYVRKAFY
jgi:GT2 family glycosyltransferase